MSLPTSQSIQIKANGTDVSSSIDYNSIALNLVLTKEVSTLKFTVLGGSALPSKYQPVAGDIIGFYETMLQNGTTVTTQLFGGTITEIETVNKSAGSLGGILLQKYVTATDWGYSMDSKLVVNSFKDMDPADIVAAIVPSGYNTSTYVQRAGYNISSIKFNYEPVTKCLQALASQIGWQWYVDALKNIHFFLAENNNAPITIDDTSGGFEYNTLDVDQNLQNMKNSVFVIGGTYKKSIAVGNAIDVYLGDGTRVAFGLVYAYVSSDFGVLLNGAAQSIGILNKETNPSAFQVLYDPGGKTITFNSVPSNGAVVTVYGTAIIPIIGHAIDQTLISKYGEFQDAIFDANILSITEAQARAQADILQFGNPVYDVRFTTLTPGLRLGQNINLNSVLYGITNYPLVVKRIRGQGRTGFQMEYSAECIGSDVVTFVDIMTTLLLQENTNNPQSDNTTLEVLLIDTEAFLIDDVLSAPTSKTPPYVYGPSGGNVGVWNLSTWG